MVKFTKMQGCGNDYVYVNCLEDNIPDGSEIARKVSEKHFGIGSDGLILIKPSKEADFFMDMYNADGSKSAMCGNGIRCVAKYVYDYGLTDKTTFDIETGAGMKHIQVETGEEKTLLGNIKKGNRVTMVTVDMGSPVITPSLVPVLLDGTQIVDREITVGEEPYRITCVSMGNPHAICFVPDTKAIDIEKIGPLFEHHEIFPERVNTEFIQVVSPNHINMRVWERGSGETLACGTGACASVYACILNGLTEDEVTVSLLGGDLKIKYDRKAHKIFMTGEALTVFEGEMTL